MPSIDGLAVRRELGRGGMGVIYLAIDKHGRSHALKLVSASGSASDARARFAQEIAAVASIEHPNVVKLVASGHAQGAPYALFERIRGCDLSSVAALPWPVVVHLAQQLAHALAAVHRAGYLHRDLKPSNVMVSRGCRVTLIDFGLAKARSARDDAGRPGHALASDLTEAGAVAGTPRYLAPELRAGASATVQSDLYALGLVVRHMLVGPSASAPLAAACAPRRLTELIEQCLAEDPARRARSAATVAAALDALEGRPGRLHVQRATHPRGLATSTTRSAALAATVHAVPGVRRRRAA